MSLNRLHRSLALCQIAKRIRIDYLPLLHRFCKGGNFFCSSACDNRLHLTHLLARILLFRKFSLCFLGAIFRPLCYAPL